ASSAVANNQPAVAENFYNRIAASTQGEDRAAALYWVGRFALQRGDQSAANEAFSQAQQAAPDSFFAQRANDILIGREAFLPPANVNFTFNEEAERQQAEEWLRQVVGITETGDLSQLSPELANDPRMIRGRELWTVAAYDEAQTEFDTLMDEARNSGDILRSYQLAHFFRDIGDFYSSIVAAADVIVGTGQATLDVPPYLARLRYPAYYNGLVQEQAQSYGFDPLLMLGLIRQESLFNPNATSFANAMGLAQVIPSTARYIAGELNWQDFTENDLYRPYIGIAFGAFYLDEQLRLFGGNQGAALAAYNAGPGYTLDWFNLSGGDIDSLVSTITFDETKRYVQRIYSHYTIYRELYGTN
ncbi:MAG: transglycosylase SLT domain-containing protein, partial [Chloroflexota bacterium]